MGPRNHVTSAVKPRVILGRLKTSHIRAIETLRFLRNKKGTCRLDQSDFYREMIRRGVLNPETSVVRKNGGVMPTESTRQTMYFIIQLCLDLALIDHAYPGDRKRHHIYELTRDGFETLNYWDDPNADCVWVRS